MLRVDLPALKHLIFKDYSLQGVFVFAARGDSTGDIAPGDSLLHTAHLSVTGGCPAVE